jgi:hypothetical protein
VHLHADAAWRGHLRFDTPRHRQHLGLPDDYPRLNEWPEWYVVDPGRRYAVTLPDGSQPQIGGAELTAGLPLALEPRREYQLRICPV